VFIVFTSLMTTDQALSPRLWPDPFQWSNYTRVFDAAPMLRYALNSMIYSTLATLGMLVSSIPVAYALARFRFRGRNLAFMLVIATMMLPPQVVVVPMYIVWARLHLVGSLWPLIIPMLFGDAFSIFLLRQFLLTVPQDYMDAARVDGCGELRTLVQVVVPMIKPAIAAVAMFQYFYSWNDFFGPQVYTAANTDAWTLAVGLWSFKGLHHVQWNITMAAALLIIAPVIFVFFLAQKAFIEGVTLTGVKG
jgi:multiple sugar transport system permease protein